MTKPRKYHQRVFEMVLTSPSTSSMLVWKERESPWNISPPSIDLHRVCAGADPGFILAGARTNAENQSDSCIELEMYKQYIDELRAKRASNFEVRNVQNCVKLCYARKAWQQLSRIEQNWARSVQTVYGWIAREVRLKFWS